MPNDMPISLPLSPPANSSTVSPVLPAPLPVPSFGAPRSPGRVTLADAIAAVLTCVDLPIDRR